ncbi:zinc finger, CCHC-type containing protein [Tanacetum coccineum]
MKKVIEDVGDDEDFKSGSWVSATGYVNSNSGIVSGCLGDIKKFLNKGKLDQVVAIVKSCSPNALGDLTVTMKDLSGTIPGTIHHKVIGEGGYGNDITVGAALILANVSVFSPKPSMHYLNITKRNVVKVFRKDTVPGSGSGSDSNSTLKNHINHPHCEALKRVAELGQSSMSRDGSIFVYNSDVLREQFAGLVIQRGLPFNHFDDEQIMRVFQNHLQPKYNHVSRMKLKEVWFTICDENEIFKDFLNTSESSNDNTNVINAPQEPFVFNQDPGENSSQSPPHIDHHCCYGYGDSLDDIFYQRCTCESCGKGAHYGYNCPLKVPTISNPEPCNNQTIDELPQTLPSFDPTCDSGEGNLLPYVSKPNLVDDSPNPPSQPPTYSYEFCRNDAHYGHGCPPQVVSLAWETILEIENAFEDKQYQPEGILELFRKLHNDVQNIHEELAEYINTPSWNRPIVYYDDDDDEDSSLPLRDIIMSELPPCVAITPVLSTEEPDNSKYGGRAS